MHVFATFQKNQLKIGIEPVRVIDLFVNVFRMIECLKHSCSGAVPGLGTRRSVTTQGRPTKICTRIIYLPCCHRPFLFVFSYFPSCLYPFQSTCSVCCGRHMYVFLGQIDPVQFLLGWKGKLGKAVFGCECTLIQQINSNNFDFTFLSKVFQLTSIDCVVIFDSKHF